MAVATQAQTKPKTTLNLLNNYFTAVRAAGCPKEQVLNFRRGGYVPQPKQLLFHAAARECDAPGGPTQIGFGGARGPGKSHAIFAQVALDDCQRVPDLKCLYLRKIGKQAREQFEDLRGAVLSNTPHRYNRQEGVVHFINGSRIIIGHFHHEGDIDAYLGIQYDVIVIEEATTLSQTKYRTLRDSNRSSKPGWRPRIYTSTNPGGSGHAWYKQVYIDPARRGSEGDTRFVSSLPTDNRFLDDDYINKLNQNTGWRLRAYRYGDWDIAAGQYFTTFRANRHVVELYELPWGWRVWAAMDYGFTHYTAVYLLAESNDGVIYILDEHAEQRWLPERHAAAITAMLARWGLQPHHLGTFVAGADVFAKSGQTGATIADKYAALGYKLKSANTDRQNGAAEILSRLGDVDPSTGPSTLPSVAGRGSGTIEPRLFINRRCARLIECLPALEHDPARPEDVLKWDTDEEGRGGDDFFDALRYGVMEANRGQKLKMVHYATQQRRKR